MRVTLIHLRCRQETARYMPHCIPNGAIKRTSLLTTYVFTKHSTPGESVRRLAELTGTTPREPKIRFCGRT